MTTDHRDLSTEALGQRLRGLPDQAAAPYGWTEFKLRRDRRRIQQGATSHVDNRRRIAAIAAGFALFVAGLAVWSRFDRSASRDLPHGGEISPPMAMDEEALESAANHAALDAAPVYRVTTSSQWLASHPTEPAIVRVDTRFAVADLEDRIAWLDDLLTTAEVERVQAAHIKTLRRERAELVDSLAQVRYAETLAAKLP